MNFHEENSTINEEHVENGWTEKMAELQSTNKGLLEVIIYQQPERGLQAQR